MELCTALWIVAVRALAEGVDLQQSEVGAGFR